MSAIANVRSRLVGRLTVACNRDEAFRLFTPLGERDWAADWQPFFPAHTTDDSAPGTVFETPSHAHATATWVVADRVPGRELRYIRVIPGANAGTVTVEFDDAEGGTSVTVTYDLTALSESGRDRLADFEAGYAAFIASWEEAIASRTGAVPDFHDRPDRQRKHPDPAP